MSNIPLYDDAQPWGILTYTQKDYRLYESLYARIRRYQFKSLEEVEALEDVLEEVKEIFISHRLDEHLTYLH